jgi:hypothetical protein
VLGLARRESGSRPDLPGNQEGFTGSTTSRVNRQNAMPRAAVHQTWEASLQAAQTVRFGGEVSGCHGHSACVSHMTWARDAGRVVLVRPRPLGGARPVLRSPFGTVYARQDLPESSRLSDGSADHTVRVARCAPDISPGWRVRSPRGRSPSVGGSGPAELARASGGRGAPACRPAETECLRLGVVQRVLRLLGQTVRVHWFTSGGR